MPATFPTGLTQANFDEAYYLSANPDIAAYIAAHPGTFANGWEHFKQGGFAEGRLWRTIAVTPAPLTDILTTNPAEATFVSDLYRRYFGRAADDAGLRFWVNEIASGRKTRVGVERAFAGDPEASSYANSGIGAPTPPLVPTPTPGGVPAGTGFLDGEIFGIPTKVVLIGAVAAYFLLGSK